jgi:hypothetical protein
MCSTRWGRGRKRATLGGVIAHSAVIVEDVLYHERQPRSTRICEEFRVLPVNPSWDDMGSPFRGVQEKDPRDFGRK